MKKLSKKIAHVLTSIPALAAYFYLFIAAIYALGWALGFFYNHC